jgi:hypothetical protein
MINNINFTTKKGDANRCRLFPGCRARSCISVESRFSGRVRVVAIFILTNTVCMVSLKIETNQFATIIGAGNE